MNITWNFNVQDAIRRTRLLNQAETEFRQLKGPHPALPWSTWAERPRSGARWYSKEISLLLRSVHARSSMSKLGVDTLCLLAWEHGRSADGIRTKLVQLLGYREYYANFEI